MAVALLLGRGCDPGAVHRNRKVCRAVSEPNSTCAAPCHGGSASAHLYRSFPPQATSTRIAKRLMNKNWVLSQEAFDALLDWLDSDREQAGIKYEEIRARLIIILTGRGCVDAEDLADETINRVTKRLSTIKEEFTGDPTRYFFGVANKIYMEYMRRKPPQPSPFPPTDSNQVEVEFRCLDK